MSGSFAGSLCARKLLAMLVSDALLVVNLARVRLFVEALHFGVLGAIWLWLIVPIAVVIGTRLVVVTTGVILHVAIVAVGVVGVGTHLASVVRVADRAVCGVAVVRWVHILLVYCCLIRGVLVSHGVVVGVAVSSGLRHALRVRLERAITTSLYSGGN